MVAKNLVTDFGSSFVTWNAYVTNVAQAGLTIDLTIPAGTYDFTSSSLAFQYGGGQKINILGAGIGSTILNSSGGSSKWNNSPYLRVALVGPQPRIDTAYAGQTSITLLDPGTFLGDFSVGSWVQINGFDPQGFGFPPNPIFWEYRQITAIVGAVLYFTAPLINTYRHQWPQFLDPRPGLDNDVGGPATVVAMSVAWDAEMYITDCTIDVSGPWYGDARTEWFNNVEFLSTPAIPSVATSSKWIGCTFANLIEVDKVLDYVEYSNCTINTIVQIQSRSCGQNFVMNDSTVGSTGLTANGEYDNCDFNAFFAALPGYGYSDSATFTDCWLDPSVQLNFRASFSAFADSTIFAYYNSSNGQFTMTQTHYGDGSTQYNRGLVPGAVGGVLVFNTNQGFNTIAGPFFRVIDVEKVGSVTDPAGNVIIHTDLHLVDIYNRVPSATAIAIHPCPSLTSVNGTGELIVFSNPHGYGRPYGSYYWGPMSDFTTATPLTISTGSGSGVGGFAPWLRMAGTVSKVEIIVTKAYTGVVPGLKGGVMSSQIYKTDLSVIGYLPQVDLTTVGTRTMLPGSTVGAQAGDTGLSLGTNWYATLNWFAGVDAGTEANLYVFQAESPAVWPEFSVEIFADQAIADWSPEEAPIDTTNLIARGLCLSNFGHH